MAAAVPVATAPLPPNNSRPDPAPARVTEVLPNDEFQTQVARALTAHESSLNQLRQQLELDFLVYDAEVKQQLEDALASHVPTGGTPKRVSTFKLVLARLVADGVPGGRRLDSESKEHLTSSLLRFKPKKPTPKNNYPWVFTLAPAVGATQNFREALADLAAHGGNDRVKVRKPLSNWGPAVSLLAERVLGKDVKGKGKDKGKEKDGKKGKGKGSKSKDGGRGKGKDKPAAFVRTAPPPAALVPPTGPPPLQTAARSGSSTPTLPEEPTEAALTGGPSASSGAAPLQTYANLAAVDENAALDAEMDLDRPKREAEGSTAVPFKKSNSPAAERKAPAVAADARR